MLNTTLMTKKAPLISNDIYIMTYKKGIDGVARNIRHAHVSTGYTGYMMLYASCHHRVPRNINGQFGRLILYGLDLDWQRILFARFVFLHAKVNQ